MSFQTMGSGRTAEEAFRHASEAARQDKIGDWLQDHPEASASDFDGDGYTGTLAEKQYFVAINDKPAAVAARFRAERPDTVRLSTYHQKWLEVLEKATSITEEVAKAMAILLLDLEDDRTLSNSAPAGCIEVVSAAGSSTKRFLFYGWARH